MSYFTKVLRRLNSLSNVHVVQILNMDVVVNTRSSRHFTNFSKTQVKVSGPLTGGSPSPSIHDDPNLWVSSPHPRVELPEGIPAPEFLRANVKNWGNSIAYECGITGRKYTHSQVYSMSQSFATALHQSKKFQPGDIIAIISQNTAEYCPVMLGIIDAGLIVSPTNPAYTREEITRQLGNSGAKGVVVSPEYVKIVRAIKNSGQCPALQMIIVTGEAQQDCHSYFEMVKVNARSGIELLGGSKCDTKEKTCLLLYSSGTTGIPKGVELTHFNMIAHMLQAGAPGVTNVQPYQNGRQERFLGVLPMFHVLGASWFLTQNLYKGAHIFVLPRFQPDTFIHALRSHKPTALNLVPPLLNFVATSPEIGKNELSELSFTGIGAAPFSEHMVHTYLEKVPAEMSFQHGYGMTEVFSGFTYTDPGPDRSKITSIGRSVPNMVTKIVDANTGQTIGRNVSGELWIKGSQVMKGYFKNEKATQECLDQNGWLRTGDIGYYDDDGYLFIVDRLKELIKVKGFQVAPSELEGLLLEHPEIVDAAVIGIPDDVAGELPRASIVRKVGSQLSAEDVNAFLKNRIASFKQLHGRIEFVEIIPKAASGKILRRELLRMYKEMSMSTK